MKHLIKYSIFENSELLDSFNKDEIESICQDLEDMLYELKDDGYIIKVDKFYYQPGRFYFPVVYIFSSNENYIINEEIIESIHRINDYMFSLDYELGSKNWDSRGLGCVKVNRYNKDADIVQDYLEIDELSKYPHKGFKRIEVVFDPTKIYWEDLHKLKRRITENNNFDADFEYLKDLFLDLKDDNFDVRLYELKDKSGRDEYRVVIKNELTTYFNINQDISDTLKRATWYMKDLGYTYTSRYIASSGTSCKFYIYQDERNLRFSGHTMDLVWPDITRIDLRFYI